METNLDRKTDMELEEMKLNIERLLFERNKQRDIRCLNEQIERIQKKTFEDRNIEEVEFDYTHR